jgi:hypothetical protein
MRGTGAAGSLQSRIKNRKGRASALRTRELVDEVTCIVDDPPRDPPGVPGPLPGPPWAFLGAGATIFGSATYFNTGLSTRRFLDPPRDPPGVSGPLP